MPTRNLFLQESDGAFLITPRALVNPETNVFESSFTTDIKNEEWIDWMRWDVSTIENDSALLERKQSSESTESGWDASNTSPYSPFSGRNEFTLEDAPSELDDVVESPPCAVTSQAQWDQRRPVQGYVTLTAAEQQSLQAIAMPYRAQATASSEPTTPTTSVSTVSRSPSPDIKAPPRKTKKRKSSRDDDDELPNALCQSRKRGHNAIEKRYRTNLNDKIACLRQGIPPLWRRSASDPRPGDEGEESDAETGDKKACQQKYGKAAILTRALEYIQHLESTTQRLGDEVAGLKTRVGAFERLAMSGSVMMSNAPDPPRQSTQKETLQTIQAGRFFQECVTPKRELTATDFKQIKHKSLSVSRGGRAQRKTRAAK
jgi:hypothetical protein